MQKWKMSAVICACCLMTGCVIPGSERTITPSPKAGASTSVAPRGGQEQELLQRVNSFRASQGRSALSFSPVLAQVAQSHANEMAARGVLSHTGANGSTVGTRARRAGYGWCLVAENIAQGQQSLAEAMVSWETSPGHRANLLNAGLKDVGLGRNGDYWAMVFAAPGC